jgi:hypothetical protein
MAVQVSTPVAAKPAGAGRSGTRRLGAVAALAAGVAGLASAGVGVGIWLAREDDGSPAAVTATTRTAPLPATTSPATSLPPAVVTGETLGTAATQTRARSTSPQKTRPRTTRPQRSPAPTPGPTTAPEPGIGGVRPADEPASIVWRPRPNTAVYWFELYRQGRLGARKVLEAWVVEPRFTVPRRAPDGSPLEPGRYSWSATPQRKRSERIRYTGLTRAGRFVITQEGRVVVRR